MRILTIVHISLSRLGSINQRSYFSIKFNLQTRILLMIDKMKSTSGLNTNQSYLLRRLNFIKRKSSLQTDNYICQQTRLPLYPKRIELQFSPLLYMIIFINIRISIYKTSLCLQIRLISTGKCL